jgi:hypothetical protein
VLELAGLSRPEKNKVAYTKDHSRRNADCHDKRLTAAQTSFMRFELRERFTEGWRVKER